MELEENTNTRFRVEFENTLTLELEFELRFGFEFGVELNRCVLRKLSAIVVSNVPPRKAERRMSNTMDAAVSLGMVG